MSEKISSNKKLPLFVQPEPPKILIATKSGEVDEIVLVCGENRQVGAVDKISAKPPNCN